MVGRDLTKAGDYVKGKRRRKSEMWYRRYSGEDFDKNEPKPLSPSKVVYGTDILGAVLW